MFITVIQMQILNSIMFRALPCGRLQEKSLPEMCHFSLFLSLFCSFYTKHAQTSDFSLIFPRSPSLGILVKPWCYRSASGCVTHTEIQQERHIYIKLKKERSLFWVVAGIWAVEASCKIIFEIHLVITSQTVQKGYQ